MIPVTVVEKPTSVPPVPSGAIAKLLGVYSPVVNASVSTTPPDAFRSVITPPVFVPGASA